MNKIELIGNVTKNPEMRTTNSGKNVCAFDLAVNDKDDTVFYRISAWNALGENCGRYLAKGKKVYVRGKLKVTVWSKNGKSGVNLDVSADEVEFLSPKNSQTEEPTEEQTEQQNETFTDINEDELPF